jgi:hypothetical protein
MNTTFWRAVLGGIATVAILTPSVAEAQIRRVSGADTRQSFGVNLGGFFPRGEDSRVESDVLVENRTYLLFDIGDFRGINFGAEYLFGVTDHIEAGLDVSFYQRNVPSIYADIVHDDLREIEQDLKLRIIPVTASVRFIPTGRNAPAQPYIGIGASMLNWRYSETGEFVDFADEPPIIFRDRFAASGNKLAPVVIGGIRFLAGDVWTAGGEVRWQKANAETGGVDAGFVQGADRIDLGGWTANFNIHFRF